MTKKVNFTAYYILNSELNSPNVFILSEQKKHFNIFLNKVATASEYRFWLLKNVKGKTSRLIN